MEGRSLTDPDAPALADLLRFTPFFAALPSEDRNCIELLKQGRVEPRSAGDLLTVGGDAAELVFILNGTARALALTSTYGVGDHYGEIDLLLDRPAASDVRAVSSVLVYRLNRATFAELLSSCHLVVRQMLRDFAVEADRANQKETSSDA